MVYYNHKYFRRLYDKLNMVITTFFYRKCYDSNMSHKPNKSSIKSKKQSAAAIQNYFDNTKMLLNNSANYHNKSSGK